MPDAITGPTSTPVITTTAWIRAVWLNSVLTRVRIPREGECWIPAGNLGMSQSNTERGMDKSAWAIRKFWHDTNDFHDDGFHVCPDPTKSRRSSANSWFESGQERTNVTEQPVVIRPEIRTLEEWSALRMEKAFGHVVFIKPKSNSGMFHTFRRFCSLRIFIYIIILSVPCYQCEFHEFSLIFPVPAFERNDTYNLQFLEEAKCEKFPLTFD